MKTLFIDTHLWNIDIALLEDGQVIRWESVKDKKNNSELIFNTLIKVIGDDTYTEIIVVNGPGSFTGVRLGVIIAKTLAYTQKIPIKVISSLECMAISTGHNLVAFSDNNGYYVGKFSADLKDATYSYLTDTEFAELSNVTTDEKLDLTKIWQYCQKKEALNPHLVNPIYIKKIGVEK